MVYTYKVYFKTTEESIYRYVRVFQVEAQANEQAQEMGRKMWEQEQKSRPHLAKAIIKKITCRKQETKPRARKTTATDRALAALNAYLLEELSK